MKASYCLPFRFKYSNMKYLNFQKLFIYRHKNIEAFEIDPLEFWWVAVKGLKSTI